MGRRGIEVELLMLGQDQIEGELKSLMDWEKPIRFVIPDLSVTSFRLSIGRKHYLYLDCKNANGDNVPLSSSYIMGNHLIGSSVKLYRDLDMDNFKTKISAGGNTGNYKIGEIRILDINALREKDELFQKLYERSQKKIQEAKIDYESVMEDFEKKLEMEKQLNQVINQKLRKRIEEYEEQLLVLPYLIKDEISRIFTKALFTKFENDPTTSPELKEKLRDFRDKAEEYFNKTKKGIKENIAIKREEGSDMDKKMERLKKKEAELEAKEKEIEENMKKMESKEIEVSSSGE